MHVRRRMSRLFSSILRQNSREDGYGRGHSTLSSLRSSLRLKKKGSGISHSQLIEEGYYSDEEERGKPGGEVGHSADLGHKSWSGRSTTYSEIPRKRLLNSTFSSSTKEDKPQDVLVDISQNTPSTGYANPCNLDDDHVDKILFIDPRSSSFYGRSETIVPAGSPSKMSVTQSNERCSRAEADPGSNQSSVEIDSLEANISNSASHSTQDKMNQASSADATGSVGEMKKISKKKIRLREMRKSAKMFKKAVKEGFVNWAESMGPQYFSSAVIPEMYECSNTTSTDYNYYRTG